jgi:hypothetical protein
MRENHKYQIMEKEDKEKTPSTNSIVKKLKSYREGAVKEFKESRLLVQIIMSAAKQFLKNKDFELSAEDKKFIKDQSTDILKLIPLIAIQIFPGSTIATPFIISLGEKLGIRLNSKVPEKYKEKEPKQPNGEIDELVDSDGSFLGSNIPILQQNMHPHKTLDQTTRMTRTSQWPFIRVYYGESEEKEGQLLDEIDMEDAFAYEETEDDRTYDECMGTMEEMGIDEFLERDERCKTFGFDKKLDKELKQEKKQGQCKNCFTKRRLSELEEQKMESLIDEIILSKKNKQEDVVSNKTETNVIGKIIKRNLDSIRKIAEKENISLDKLVRYLKKGEQ